MTEEVLKQFCKGEAFIDMRGTTEDDWINLVEQCARVGFDLNERARSHIFGNREVGPINFNYVQPFVYYQRLISVDYPAGKNKYLKCSGADKLTTWSSNILGLPIYRFTPSKMPVFEI